MPDLKIAPRWRRYEPDLPGNRRTETSPKEHRPFYFEVAADLTKEQLRSMHAQLSALDQFPDPPPSETPEARMLREQAERDAVLRGTAEALKPFVRFGVEPLKLDGEDVKTLEQYLQHVSVFADETYVAELAAVVSRVNSMAGMPDFFYARLSGGFSSTR